MKTIGRVLSFGIFTICLATASGPAPQNLFPTTVGSTWGYSGTMNGAPVSMKAVITSARKSNGVTEAVVAWSMGGTVTQEETYRVSASGVERTRSGKGGANHISPPLPVIKYPMSVGKSWKWKGALSTGGATMSSTADLKVGALEKIKSAAGVFNAYRVDVNLLVNAGGQTATVTNSYWFAPGAGMVKQSASVKGTGQAVTIEAVVSSLKIK